MAAVLAGAGEAGLAVAADSDYHLCLYRCHPDHSGEDKHGESLFANVYHGSADARDDVAGVLFHDFVLDTGRESGFEHCVGDRHDAYHGADRRIRDYGGELGELPDTAKDNRLYDDDAVLGDYLIDNGTDRRLGDRCVYGYHHGARLCSGYSVCVQLMVRVVWYHQSTRVRLPDYLDGIVLWILRERRGTGCGARKYECRGELEYCDTVCRLAADEVAVVETTCIEALTRCKELRVKKSL